MSSITVNPRRTGALACLGALVALTLPVPASADTDGDVQVVNTETVQVYTDADGAVQSKRVYEQIAMTGTGDVDLVNPIETDGLRNLDEFGGFDVDGGNQLVSQSVDGEARVRTVSSYDGDLPLEVETTYVLDGEEVEPGDIVGESGELEVTYTVRNVTAVPQEVTFDDGRGGEVTETVDVPVPMVGSLTTTAPSSFTDVRSEQANMAGDGKGGTKLSFTMTLFPPIGSDTAEFGYTATISDGVVPRADISALPISPLDSPTFKTAATSYQGGADTGAELAAGAATIDENLLKLRDGAGELLAGIIKLRDGSAELREGLSGKAAPGAVKLADGMGQLDAGIGELDAGAHRLDAGLGKISDGSAELAAGAKKASEGGGLLRDGAGTLSAGLGELSGGALELDAGAAKLLAGQKALRDGLRQLEAGLQVLPATVQAQLADNVQYQTLLTGLSSAVTGIGNPDDIYPANQTLFGLMNATLGSAAEATTAASSAKGGVATVKGRLSCGTDLLEQLTGDGNAPAECTIADGVPALDLSLLLPEQVTALRDLAASLSLGSGELDTVDGQLNTVLTKAGTITQLIGAVKPKLSSMRLGLVIAVNGIPTLVDTLTNQLSATLLSSISAPAGGCQPDTKTLLCGANALVDGTGQLKAGTAKLVKGSGQLGAGGDLLYDKLSELATGLEQIGDGSGRLSAGAAEAKAGTSTLVDGTGQLKDGSGQLAAGSEELAAGLGDAAEGSGKITAGLGTAADGAPQLVDGAQRLSDEGTSKLVDAGVETAQNYGKLYATIEAGSERAKSDGMAFGAPEGAQGLTAYSYVVQGEDGESGRNLTRGLVGLGLLGAAGGGLLLRRRLLV